MVGPTLVGCKCNFTHVDVKYDVPMSHECQLVHYNFGLIISLKGVCLVMNNVVGGYCARKFIEYECVLEVVFTIRVSC